MNSVTRGRIVRSHGSIELCMENLEAYRFLLAKLVVPPNSSGYGVAARTHCLHREAPIVSG